MIWPPAKAWTSKSFINGQRHFIAINYGGKDIERWVILISVIESDLIFKVSWSELSNQSNWMCGWDEDKENHEIKHKTIDISDANSFEPSIDSGLTIPITTKMIRPWIYNT
tara:strand:+ start:1395 stop:1727 length:333 start_codon:yes stop_codon:yes gene_type:complete